MSDLSRVKNSMTYQFIKVVSTLYAIQTNSELTAAERRDECLVAAMQALNDTVSISKESYDRKREELINARTDSDIIRVVERTINNGKKVIKPY